MGDTVEVRDSSSLASRPRWYRGEVKKVADHGDPIRDLSCGAELEEYEFEGQEKGPIVLLGQTQQVRRFVRMRGEAGNMWLAQSIG